MEPSPKCPKAAAPWVALWDEEYETCFCWNAVLQLSAWECPLLADMPVERLCGSVCGSGFLFLCVCGGGVGVGGAMWYVCMCVVWVSVFVCVCMYVRVYACVCVRARTHTIVRERVRARG